jgi:hypothetical protein
MNFVTRFDNTMFMFLVVIHSLRVCNLENAGYAAMIAEEVVDGLCPSEVEDCDE